ncbi:zinc finger protein 502 isoform X2 [Cephus cinctus]|nr:zinc finger protein 502 isoform X2 [Cephus cinctus]
MAGYGNNRISKSILHLTNTNDNIIESNCISTKHFDNIKVSNTALLADVKVEMTQLHKERLPFKRETYRTRRISMFKRMTSMENLKNFKERQRQYIKKNVNTKHDSADTDSALPGVTYIRAQRIANIDSDLAYKCTKCNRSYSSKKSLDRHFLTHNDKKYKCEKCDKQFFRLDKLLEHGKLHEFKEKPKPVRCSICDKNFRKTDTMVRHLNVHKKANPKEVFAILKDIRDKRKLENSLNFLCEEDIKKETNQNEESCLGKELRKRGSTSNEDQDYNPDSSNSESNSESDSDSGDDSSFHRCKHCAKCCSSEKALQRHLRVHQEKKYVCNVCNMKFFREDRLKSHRERYSHDEDKACLELQKPPDDKSAIKLINSWIREELDSDNEGKGFPCKICGKSYVTKKSLLKHKANAHESQEGCCSSCGQDCNCSEKSKEPEKRMEKLKPYTCDECNKSFEKETKLQKHVRIHERAKEQQDSNFKRFLCHICSKTFRQNTGLMFHMRTHTGYKPHVCKYCGRGFTSNSNCINHERTHTGDRPFVCHFCSAAFAKSCTLKAHITTHTGEANYHCKTCGKSFRRLKYLKEHRFTHTGEKPYACKICGTAYSHSGSLFVHEKKCKAQYNSYQTLPPQNTQNYCQAQAACTTSPAVAPIISTLPASHHLVNINNSLGRQVNKNYMESMQRMSAHAVAAAAVGNPSLHMHSNSDVSDMASAVRNFAIIGQMFHS